jgi:PIN domain nuclease of toxin-antitoxin system
VRLLLDTHVLLWSQQDRRRIAAVMSSLEDPANDLLLSAAVGWEIAIKYALGRLPLPEPPGRWVPERAAAIGAEIVPVTQGHALGVAELPHLHGDPFDRLLVSQARHLGATLVTADAILARYDVETLLV